MDLLVFNADQQLCDAIVGMGFGTHFDGPTLVVERTDLATDVMLRNLQRATEGYDTREDRVVGYGEDGPRWSHENGHYVDNYPWLP